MISTTPPHSSRAIESPLSAGELAISFSRDDARAVGIPVAGADGTAAFAASRASGFASAAVTEGAAGKIVAAAGKILTGIGTQAINAGTSKSVLRVTSQTRWRAPADARCIESVIPSATSRIKVAFASRSIIERLESLLTKLEKTFAVIGVISRSGERDGCWCGGA